MCAPSITHHNYKNIRLCVSLHMDSGALWRPCRRRVRDVLQITVLNINIRVSKRWGRHRFIRNHNLNGATLVFHTSHTSNVEGPIRNATLWIWMHVHTPRCVCFSFYWFHPYFRKKKKNIMQTTTCRYWRELNKKKIIINFGAKKRTALQKPAELEHGVPTPHKTNK